MKAVILAAGAGRRMRQDLPKCMLKYDGVSILERMINQIKMAGIEQVIVVVGYKKEKITDEIKDVTYVYNDCFDKDTNSYSLYLALKDIDDDVVVFEADIIVEDEFIRYVFGTDFENKSVWFVHGKLQEHQNGGIIKTDGKGNVVDIKILDIYNQQYKNWYKTSGIMRIAKEQVKPFSNLLKSSTDYFHMVWKKNIFKFPSVIGETKFYDFATFNTCEDYYSAIKQRFGMKKENRGIYKAKVECLFPIERYDADRLADVRDGIINNGNWVRPIRVERGLNLVLDGHHSLALAKELGLKFIPAIGFHYDELEIWSLREDIAITKENVIDNALKNNPYPYKTVKHKFPNVECCCNVSLTSLKEDND